MTKQGNSAEMDPNDPLLQGDGPCSVRLHVGGLGPTVITNDLVRTFSSLGKVASVDFVRTKGRNFAYIEFQAASPQQVKRLFSLYNGCMWKGGRLKLEKAKEFYLDKLHREWGEQKQMEEQGTEKPPASALTPSEDLHVGEKSDGITIYFPHLKKVKKIPDKGLGKHKRSFERMEAMPCSLLKLCNCGDDCCAISTSNCNLTSQCSSLDDNKGEGFDSANKKPLKNFTQDRTPKRNGVNIQTARSTKSLDKSCDIAPVDREKIPNGTSTESLDKTSDIAHAEREKIRTGISSESVDKTSDISEDVVFETSDVSQENEIASTENIENEITSTENVDSPPTKRVRFDLDSKTSKDTSKESEVNWVQKASWKALVGGTGRISFSLTSILGQDANKPEETAHMNNEKQAGDLKTKDKDSVMTNALSSSTNQSGQPGALPDKLRNSATELKSVIKRSHSEENCQSHDDGDYTEQQKQDSLLHTIMNKDKECTFMKSEKSEKEWLAAKRAVKGLVKRSHKDALRSTKMLHKKMKY